MQARDAAQITAHQKANWDSHADAYSEALVSKDFKDAATLQVISAIRNHKELATGEQVPFKLGDRRFVVAAYMQPS